MSADGSLTVLKIGGSLLTLPDLRCRLESILSRFANKRRLLVVGGGQVADVVRRWETVHAISDEAAHWLALRAMSLNEAFLHELLPDTVLVTDRHEIHAAWTSGLVPILWSECFLRTEESTGDLSLPHDWSVTSDSIAAWVAHRLNGQSLILLKSADLPSGKALDEAANAGLVDDHFPLAGAELSISWINVQSDPRKLVAWMSGVQASG